MKISKCGYWKRTRNEKGEVIKKEWIPQRDVEATPELEAAIRARWEYSKLKKQMPKKLKDAEKLDLIVKNGVDAVRQLESERQAQIDSMMPQVEAAKEKMIALDKIANAGS